MAIKSMLTDFCFPVAVVLAWSKRHSFWVFLKEKVNYVSLMQTELQVQPSTLACSYMAC